MGTHPRGGGARAPKRTVASGGPARRRRGGLPRHRERRRGGASCVGEERPVGGHAGQRSPGRDAAGAANRVMRSHEEERKNLGSHK